MADTDKIYKLAREMENAGAYGIVYWTEEDYPEEILQENESKLQEVMTERGHNFLSSL